MQGYQYQNTSYFYEVCILLVDIDNLRNKTYNILEDGEGNGNLKPGKKVDLGSKIEALNEGNI